MTSQSHVAYQRATIIMMVALALGGCTPEQDVAQCKMEAIRLYPNDPPKVADDAASQYAIACMNAKGYWLEHNCGMGGVGKQSNLAQLLQGNRLAPIVEPEGMKRDPRHRLHAERQPIADSFSKGGGWSKKSRRVDRRGAPPSNYLRVRANFYDTGKSMLSGIGVFGIPDPVAS